MRFISCALLTLLAAMASGQMMTPRASVATEDLFCHPNFATPEGGAEITFASNHHYQFKAPEVFFGDVRSPRVTVVNSDTVKAVAPAHARGIVDVTIVDLGAVLFLRTHSPFAFQPVLEEILIPIAYQPISANYGTRWVSEISVYNDSDDTVSVDRELCNIILIDRWYDCSQGARRVAPHSSMRIEPWSNSADYPAMFLWPPADHADRLHFTVRLRETSRDPDGPGTEIPVVRSRDFQQTKVWLSSIPTSSRFRSTLRVYTRWYSVTVRVKDNATGELLKEWLIPRYFPTDSDPFGTVTLPGLLEAPEVRSHERVRIEVESESPVWALLTLTDNESQRVQIFTPQ